MQKKLFLIMFGLIALISFPTAKSFGREGGDIFIPPVPPTPSAPEYYPEVGDKIVLVNYVRVHNEDEFRREVRNSPESITLGILDHRTGKIYNLKTRLLSPNNQTRLGVYVRNTNSQDGVIITGLVSDSPIMHCKYTKTAFTLEDLDCMEWYKD